MNSSQRIPFDGEIRDGRHFLAVRVYHEDTDFTGIVYHRRAQRPRGTPDLRAQRPRGTPSILVYFWIRLASWSSPPSGLRLAAGVGGRV
jgi:hypothetical protein